MFAVARIAILFAALAALLAPAAAQAEWRKYETAHFQVYSQESEKEATRLAEGLEKIDGLMRLATSLKPDTKPVKVRIYQVGSEDEVERALGEKDSGVAGFYNNNIFGPFAVTPRHTSSGDNLFTAELVLHHEYAHHFMLQYFPAIYPGWYVEGFAELIGSSTIMPDGRVAYGMPARHRGDAISSDWVSLEELLTKSPEQIQNFDLYGQGWAMTHFFTFSKTRAPQMRAYLGLLHTGKSSAEAAKTAFGDLAALNREAHLYLLGGNFAYKPVEVPLAKPLVQKVEAVDPSEAALIPEIIAFRDDDLAELRKDSARVRQYKLREENIARIRAKAALYPNAPFALHMLATTEYVAGNCPAAEAAADRLLAIQPGHIRGMVMKSLCLAKRAGSLSGPAQAAQAQQARALALKANRADPDDALPLLAFYESFHSAGLKAPPAAVEALADASATLPHDTRIRLLLVDELAGQHHWAAAIQWLMPIANDTHPSPRREAARVQLARLQAELAKESAGKAGG
jgi:hypothetical protein